MNSHLFQDGIILFHFKTIRRILFILRRDVTGSARLSTGFVLGTFEDNLNAVAFLCHFTAYLLNPFLVFRGANIQNFNSKSQ
jgi:hypothetical protein